MTEREIDDCFEAFRAAFRSRDEAALRACWTPDVRVWHSADGRAKDAGEYLAFINGLPQRVVNFVDTQRDYFANGFVQQSTVEVTHPDGTIDTNRICLVVKMEDGRISRIDEYGA